MIADDILFHLKFALKMTQPPLKCADFDQYLPITYRNEILHERERKKFNYHE